MRIQFLSRVAAAVCPCVLLGLALSGVSCRITEDSVQQVEGDMIAPELIAVSQLNETQLRLSFSEDVGVSAANVYADGVLFCTGTAAGSGTEAAALSAEPVITLDAAPAVGVQYVLTGTAADKKGNSLLFTIPFSGYNGRVPALVLSEIRSEYSSGKSEFIELYVLSPGNLAGVTVYSANDDKYGAYEFPAADVAAGEYVTLHYRLSADDAEACVDETGADLNASASKESCGDSRDFWIRDSVARIGKSDVVLLRDRAGGKLLDALPYSESSKTAWKTDALRAAAQEAADAGVWPAGGDDFSESFCSDGVTATRTLSRRNVAVLDAAAESGTGFPPSDKTSWIVTATGGATPGMPNSEKEYSK
ncbi:hypothetical protein [Treponema brennaborense]|uniref:TP-1001-like C-terminal domain-containing protein n=1 Tax=Treponema brennaborense (strain DSM 12168 / CIP 105900 / DD5/3) TaxID=906968 RepID=F4LPT7_TREBD|nr:hypothetical protein [Treponema brennaborense]AEE16029.1 hypothetical protein Trebr_0586 [Treponema brennaborense DSM 12168]